MRRRDLQVPTPPTARDSCRRKAQERRSDASRLSQILRLDRSRGRRICKRPALGYARRWRRARDPDSRDRGLLRWSLDPGPSLLSKPAEGRLGSLRVAESVTNLCLIGGCIYGQRRVARCPRSICSWLMPENDSRANSWPSPSTKNALPSTKLTFSFSARSNSARSSTPEATQSTGRSRRAARSTVTRPLRCDSSARSITVRFAW